MTFALVVDDSSLQRKYLVDILVKTKGFHKILEAQDADVAMKMCMKFDPDLILMDYDMPRMDGLTASEMIIKLKKNANIIMVTATNRNNLRKKAFEIGIKDVIIKPYTDVQIVKSLLSLFTFNTANTN
jgi:response regulator NasT